MRRLSQGAFRHFFFALFRVPFGGSGRPDAHCRDAPGGPFPVAPAGCLPQPRRMASMAHGIRELGSRYDRT